MLWTIIAGFVYITWTQRIWPEIRVDAAKPVFKPIDYNDLEVFSASELLICVNFKPGKRHFFGRNYLLKAGKPGKCILWERRKTWK